MAWPHQGGAAGARPSHSRPASNSAPGRRSCESCWTMSWRRWRYPLVNEHNELERSTIFNGKIHYKWPFSIAMLNYQRVDHPFRKVDFQTPWTIDRWWCHGDAIGAFPSAPFCSTETTSPRSDQRPCWRLNQVQGDGFVMGEILKLPY